jgi:hypothetical protein
MHKILLTGFFLLFTTVLFAQDSETENIETDRPSQNDASKVVPQGTFQMENGFGLQRDKITELNATQTEYRYPNASLRLGIFKFAELRLKAALKHYQTKYTGNSGNSSEEKQSTETGWGNTAIGTKIQLSQGKGALPEAAFQAEVQMPWGSKQYDPENPEPRLRFAFTNELTDKVSLHYNLGMEWQNTEGETERKYDHNPQYALALSYKLTEKFKTYVEFFGQKTQAAPFEQSIDAGFAFLVLPNLQLDAYSALGLTEAAPDFFFEAGFSIRLPK